MCRVCECVRYRVGVCECACVVEREMVSLSVWERFSVSGCLGERVDMRCCVRVCVCNYVSV